MQTCVFFFFLRVRRAPSSTLFPYTTLFRSVGIVAHADRAPVRRHDQAPVDVAQNVPLLPLGRAIGKVLAGNVNRSEEHTSNSSHSQISYAVFCLKKKTLLDSPLANPTAASA